MRDGRLLAGGCMLPLSKNVNLSRDLGMRHRAGIGMSENSDAVVVIVSEETGTISVAIGGLQSATSCRRRLKSCSSTSSSRKRPTMRRRIASSCAFGRFSRPERGDKHDEI